MGINSGRYSKFQERLKRIVRNRFKKKKRGNQNNLENVDELVKEEYQLKGNNVYIGKKAESRYVARGRNKKVSVEELDDYVEDLGAELLSKLKSSFIDKLDELDVIESELFLLNDSQENTLEIERIREIKKRIDEIIEEINNIIDTYNLYNRNYDLGNIIDLDDRYLADDIIRYRELLDDNKERAFVKEYKLLDEFGSLYVRLSSIKDETDELLKKNEEKLFEFDIRDKKYKEIVESLDKIDDSQKECLYEINKINDYLKNLDKIKDKISSEEYMTYHLRGLEGLIGQSLRYLAFSMLSPLSGIIPSIGVNAMMTRRMIRNIYQNLHYEEVKHIHYSAVNYESELNNKLVDVNYIEDYICDTLDDIKKLREDFMMQYNSEISGYTDTLNKINEMEKVLFRYQKKTSIVKKQLLTSKKINSNKLVRVKEMNEKNVA